MEGILDRKSAPQFKDPEVFKLPSCRKEYLSNGIPYFEYLSSPQPALKIEFVFSAGQLFEEKPSQAFFTTKLLTSGTSKLSANQIEEKIARFGAFLELNYAQDSAGLTLYCLAKHLESLLPVIIEIFNDTVFVEDELENFRNIQIQNLKVNSEKTAYLASVEFKEKFFGNHPYARSNNNESLQSIHRQDLVSFFENKYHWSNASIFVSGGGATSFTSIFEKHLGAFKVSSNQKDTYPKIKTYGFGKANIDKESLQSSIRLGLPAVGLHDTNYHRVSLLNEVFGGYFGSRLMKNIREDKGYTYGIHSSVVNYFAASYLVIGSDVKGDVREKAIEEIIKEMKILKTEKISSEEIESVKNYMVGSYLNSLNTAFSVMEKHKTIYCHNLPNDFFEKYYSAIQSTTEENLLQTAGDIFIEDNYLIISAG